MPEISSIVEKRNFFYNVVEGSLWVTGSLLMSTQTVLPALITRLGGSNIEVGALSVIVYIGLFLPQIFSARYAQTITWKKPMVLGFGIAQRCVILAIALIIFFLGNKHPSLTLWLFLLLFLSNQVILGIVTPVWFDFFTKLTPLQKRGRLAGIRNAIAGALSLVGSVLLTWLLTSFSFPYNYAMVCFATFMIQLSAIVFQARLVEEHPSVAVPLQSMKEYFIHLRDILKEHRPFIIFLASSVFLVLATLPISFFTVYAIKHFQADETMIGTFTLITVCGQIVGALLNGYIADHHGNKIALISASLSILCSCLLALFAPSIWWFSVVFFGVGVFIGSELMIRYNLAIEYGPPEQRATYIGLMNTLLAPVYSCGLLGGMLSDTLGYKPVFLIGAMFSLIGISMLITLVQEPRKR